MRSRNDIALKKLTYVESQFNAAILTLSEAVCEKDVNQYVKDSTIKRFEYTYELAWNIIKHVLAFRGIYLNTPKELFSRAFSEGWILSPDNWEDMVYDRNSTSHTYKSRSAEEIYRRILQDYYNDFTVLQMNIGKVIKDELRSPGEI